MRIIKRIQFVLVTLVMLTTVVPAPSVALPTSGIATTDDQPIDILGKLKGIEKECNATKLNGLLDAMLQQAGSVNFLFQYLINEIKDRLKDPNLGDEEREELEEMLRMICELVRSLAMGEGGGNTTQGLSDFLIKLCKLTPKDFANLKRKFDLLILDWRSGAAIIYNLHCVDHTGIQRY